MPLKPTGWEQVIFGMAGWMKNISPFWLDSLDTALNESTSLCYAVFSESGKVVHANEGMRLLLRIEANREWQPEDLVNPDFTRLMSMPESDVAVFEGLFTIGNRLDVSRNIKGKAYRRENQLLIVGEFNVLELETLNRHISTMNQEINNLQREIIKEKLMLENTYAQLQSAYRQMERDHGLAAEVLARVCSKDFSRFPKVRVFSAPVEKVGGDVFFVAERPSGGIQLMLGDFTGHGLSAALGAIPTSDIFYKMTADGHSISDILREINRKLKLVLPTGLFLC
ncbi:MAG: SpoIIE family protein phosphatase, partial [Syntrophobacteraceae bacterium]